MRVSMRPGRRLGSGEAISTGAALCLVFVALLFPWKGRYLLEITGMSAGAASLVAVIVIPILLVLAIVLYIRHRRQRWENIQAKHIFDTQLLKYQLEAREKQTPTGASNVPPPPETHNIKTGRP